MKMLTRLFLIALIAMQTVYAVPDTQSADSLLASIKPLAPEPIHPRVAQVVSYLLSHNHYHKKALDDSLSSEMFDNYLDILDHGKLYFLKSDIDHFEVYRYQLDDFLQRGSLNAAYEIYNTFALRYAERYLYIKKRLQQPFDFSIDESLLIDRENQPWASSPAELDDLWRKRLKNDFLNLKLSGKKPDKIRETLQKRYGNIPKWLKQTESEDVFQRFMNALAECFDPHTSYMSPKISEDFKIRMSLSLEGIGASLRTEGDYTKVVEVIAGGPADRSGLLHANDRITAVGQGEHGELTDVIGWRIDDVVQLIRGKKGTTVRLQILPADAPAGSPPDTIKLVRDKVLLSDRAAKSDTLDIKHHGKKFRYGVIDIPDFYLDYDAMRKGDPNYASTSGDVRKLIKQLQGAGVDGIIIDLRNNGGGFLTEAINLSGLFIKTGPVVQVRDTRGRVKVERDMSPEIAYDGPLAILVNRFSASASEIFAAAMQDYARGIIIGDQSFGKGTVQNIIRLNRFFPRTTEKLGQIKMTIAKFYRINGGSTQNVGVIPDISLPSRFAGLKIGERSEKNALRWDEIAPLDYRLYDPSLPSYIPRLVNQHLARMHSDSALKYLQEEVDNLRMERQRKYLSLEEKKRKKLREKAESLKNKLKKAKKKNGKNKEEDIYLTEAARILSDYILIR